MGALLPRKMIGKSSRDGEAACFWSSLHAQPEPCRQKFVYKPVRYAHACGRSARQAGIGTGLGLSITRGLLAAIGGSVTVENNVGAGARFSIVVPAVTRERVSPELEAVSVATVK